MHGMSCRRRSNLSAQLDRGADDTKSGLTAVTRGIANIGDDICRSALIEHLSCPNDCCQGR